jgi:hypothetical protein
VVLKRASVHRLEKSHEGTQAAELVVDQAVVTLGIIESGILHREGWLEVAAVGEFSGRHFCVLEHLQYEHGFTNGSVDLESHNSDHKTAARVATMQ